MLERIRNIYARIPDSYDGKDSVKGALLGALGGGSLSLLTPKYKKMLRKLTLGGAVGGSYVPLIKYNAETEMGGHWRTEPDYYRPLNLVEQLNPHKKEVVFYVSGAADGEIDKNLSQSSAMLDNNIFTFNWADGKKLARAINAVPEDYKVRVVAHSAGGTAFKHLDNTSRAIESVDMLDPVDLSLNGLRNPLKIRYGRPGNIKRLTHHLPETFINPTSIYREDGADTWTDGNPLRISLNHSGDNTVLHAGENHSFINSNLRLSEHYWKSLDTAAAKRKYVENFLKRLSEISAMDTSYGVRPRI